MPNNIERWVAEKVKEFDVLQDDCEGYVHKELSAFLRQVATDAYNEGREEGLKEVEKAVGENHKGTFTDEAGHDCWYIDALKNLINQLKNHEK